MLMTQANLMRWSLFLGKPHARCPIVGHEFPVQLVHLNRWPEPKGGEEVVAQVKRLESATAVGEFYGAGVEQETHHPRNI